MCVLCFETAVTEPEQCSPLYKDVLKMFTELGIPLPAEPPVLLVDA